MINDKLRGPAAVPPTLRGFTLVELMIAIAILAILMGIAIPSYNQWVVKSNRAEGQSLLVQTAQSLERCFTRFSAYDDSNCDIVDGGSLISENEKYTVTVSSARTSFSLVAAPAREDTQCGKLKLTHIGERTSDTGDARCW